MRALSLVRAWLHGIGAFLAVTAAFVLALSLAISGPPTAEEMTGLSQVSSTAGAEISRAARGFGARLCEVLGPHGDIGGCPQRVAQAPPAAEPPPPLPRAPVATPPIVLSDVETRSADDLLGGTDGPVMRAPPPAAEQSAEAARPRTAPRASPHPRASQERRARAVVSLRPPVTAEALAIARDVSARLREAAPMAPPIRSETAPPPAPTKPSPASRDPYWEDEPPYYEEDRAYRDDRSPYYEDERGYYEDEYYPDETW